MAVSKCNVVPSEWERASTLPKQRRVRTTPYPTHRDLHLISDEERQLILRGLALLDAKLREQALREYQRGVPLYQHNVANKWVRKMDRFERLYNRVVNLKGTKKCQRPECARKPTQRTP